MLRLEDRENVGKVILSTEEYEDANSFHGEDVSTTHRDIQYHFSLPTKRPS